MATMVMASPQDDEESEREERSERAQGTSAQGTSAKLGFLGIASAKLWFIVTGYAIAIGLPYLLDSAQEFGRYSSALRLVSVLNNVLIVATIQSVSKHVSEVEGASPTRVRQALSLQLAIGLALSLALYFLAPPLAALFRDASMVPLIQIGAIVVFVYSLYGTLVGALNGRGFFLRQAGLDVTFSTLRAAGILGGAALLSGAIGALWGWALSAVIITCTAFAIAFREYLGPKDPAQALPWSRWLTFLLPIWGYQLCLNGMLLLDIQILKGVVADQLLRSGVEATGAADIASELAGYYGASQTFAFVPYQLILALTFVIFPMVSRATSSGDREEAASLLRGAFRFALLALLALATPIAGAAEGVLGAVFPSEYSVAAPALRILILGIVFFALFVVCATVLTSAGKAKAAAIVALIGVGVVVVGGYFANVYCAQIADLEEAGHQALIATASATSIGMAIAFFLSAFAVIRELGALVPARTVLRALCAGAVGAAVGYAVPHSSFVMTVVALAAGFFAFWITLALLGELGAELQKLRDRLRSST